MLSRPRLRCTATLLAGSALLLAVGVTGGSGPDHLAPPGADGAPSAGVSATPGEQWTDAARDPGRDAGDARLHRLERELRTASSMPGPGSGPADGPATDIVFEADEAAEVDPGPDAEFVPAMVTDEGYEVVGGTARAGSGERVTYTVEVDPEVDADPLAVTAVVEQALHDPRSWAADLELVRVDDPTDARIRVVLAVPGEVDRLCAEAGLTTAGRFSCWNGRIAALNAGRWVEGAADFDDLDTYRNYLVNHEFGHGLGYGHVDCPGTGQPAPVMMQQTMSTGACTANGWPYPERSAD